VRSPLSADLFLQTLLLRSPLLIDEGNLAAARRAAPQDPQIPRGTPAGSEGSVLAYSSSMRQGGVVLGFVWVCAVASCGDNPRGGQCGYDRQRGVCHCSVTGRLDPAWAAVDGCEHHACCFLDLDTNNGDCVCVRVLQNLDPNSAPVPSSGPLPPDECLRRVPVRNARVIASSPPPQRSR
jgi:hypothetical protein